MPSYLKYEGKDDSNKNFVGFEIKFQYVRLKILSFLSEASEVFFEYKTCLYLNSKGWQEKTLAVDHYLFS